MFKIFKYLTKRKSKLTKEQDKCPYCHGYTKKVRTITDESVWISIDDKLMHVIDDRGDKIITSFNIKNCFRCGRKL
jgi:uncharacterized protein with PIN domain